MYIDSAYNTHGFLYKDDTFLSMDYPGAVATWPNGINDDDQIIGMYRNAGGLWHGFLYDARTGTLTPLDYPGSTSTQAGGINDNVHIVGIYTGLLSMFVATPTPQ